MLGEWQTLGSTGFYPDDQPPVHIYKSHDGDQKQE
jgi:hypothetical protein